MPACWTTSSTAAWTPSRAGWSARSPWPPPCRYGWARPGGAGPSGSATPGATPTTPGMPRWRGWSCAGPSRTPPSPTPTPTGRPARASPTSATPRRPCWRWSLRSTRPPGRSWPSSRVGVRPGDRRALPRPGRLAAPRGLRGAECRSGPVLPHPRPARQGRPRQAGLRALPGPGRLSCRRAGRPVQRGLRHPRRPDPERTTVASSRPDQGACPVTAQPARPIQAAGSQHAAALHVLGAPCLWPRARRFVDDAGEVDWLRLELAAGQWSYGDWLLVSAAHDLDDGTAAAGLRRLCITLAPQALRRVVEAVLLLRPDAALEPGGGGVRWPPPSSPPPLRCRRPS